MGGGETERVLSVHNQRGSGSYMHKIIIPHTIFQTFIKELLEKAAKIKPGIAS